MSTFNEIQSELNAIKELCTNDDQMTALNDLHAKFISFCQNYEQDSKWVAEVIKHDSDAAQAFEENGQAYHAVRDVQDIIINYFSN